jgi:hypothetical protein
MPCLGSRGLRFGLLQAAALLLAASRGRAQVVSGQAVLAPRREPAAGVVIELLDSAGATRVTWTFSDEQGRFVFRDLGRRTFMLRARRIGLRPLRFPIVLGAADTSLVLRMTVVPLSLPPVVARDERACNSRPDSGLALGTLWNDAESALLAASVTRRSSAYQFAVVDYTRDFDFRTRALEAIAFRDVRSTGARPWTSIPASRLRRNGFVVIGRDSATFIAPDIETLVSRDFIDSHCFELGSHRPASDSLIGIDFTPAGAPKHPEVRGTIWLDRATHELRSIDFHYVHLGLSAADSAAAGQALFAPLGTGGWIVTDWSVRAPVLRLAVDRPLEASAPDRLRVSGSTLREVRGDSGVLWSRPTSAAELRIMSGPRHRPMGRGEAVAYLVGSDRRASTDSNGVVTFSNLVDGAYLVDVGTRELDVLGWARRRVQVNVDAQRPRETVDVEVASTLTAARAVCGADAPLLGDATGVIVGRVTDGTTPVAGREVRVSWVGAAHRSAAPPVVSRTTQTMAGDGRFIVCGVPRDQPIQIRVTGASASTTTQIARDQVVAIVELTAGR